jgi:hypothetical protein
MRYLLELFQGANRGKPAEDTLQRSETWQIGGVLAPMPSVPPHRM